MNLNLDIKPQKIELKRKILYIVVLVICILAILSGAYVQVFKTNYNNTNNKYVELSNEQYIELEEQFTTMFNNNINNNSNYNLTNINKINTGENIVSNSYVNMDSEDNKYNLNVTIPYINIDTPTIRKYNEEIQSIFQKKAEDILESSNNLNTIYSVEYVAYINADILSLAIRSTLKEENNAQRVIMQTYNYNLDKNKVVTIDNLLEIKGISKNYAESKVREKIKQEQLNNEKLQALGYMIFERDYKSDIYKMQNTTDFFLGKDGHLYLVYAYGNNNYTSEMDIYIL